ncbi:MAG: hypothetical protein J3K34DRAFT_521638 [Monoraphidium minutum]|nr:MAG: hypothetical protein J3K34DRAFT_521638 [Monoraphidium minutum]
MSLRGQQPTAPPAVGVVIVDHGSRAKASNDMLLEFVSLYKASTGQPIVEAAHMELAEPSIANAIARCAEQGAGRVVVAPYFLSRGRHVQQDVPNLVAAAAAAHPGLELVVADPIGIDPLMIQLISNRVQAAAAAGAAAGGGAAAAAPVLQGASLAVALAAAAAMGAAAAAATLSGVA